MLGRTFSAEDLALIGRLIASHREQGRAAISRELAKTLNWYQPNGRLKDMTARTLLLKLHRAGLITLPPPKKGNGNGRLHPAFSPASDPAFPVELPLRDLGPLQFHLASDKPPLARLWREFVDRYHYLGHRRILGPQIRYLVESSHGWLAALGFGGAAWKVGPRDRWIGWTPAIREQRLPLIVNNVRFLILPWVRSKNLASHVLAAAARRLPDDWRARYAVRPLLLETFVETVRFRGTCYKAANWIHVGTTQGRGRMDRFERRLLPVKDILIFPLHPDARRLLNAP
jgi:hypothetical protein